MNNFNLIRRFLNAAGVLSLIGMVATGAFITNRVARAADPAAPSDEIKQLLKKAEDLAMNPLSLSKAKKGATALTADEIAKLAEYYRAQYPFESLRERLAYEAKLPAEREKPQLSKEAAKRLKEADVQPNHYGGDLRSKSLAALHAKEVSKFITQDGFGLSRMEPPSPRSLPLPERLQSRPNDFVISGEHTAGGLVDVPHNEPDDWLGADAGKIPGEKQQQVMEERYAAWTVRHNPFAIPSQQRLLSLHDASSGMFASTDRNGLVKGVDKVAGFGAHAAQFVPVVDLAKPQFWSFAAEEEGVKPADPSKYWQTKRMNLVSLLKHPEPGVYDSEQLPAMEELAKAKTRPLDKFETDALAKLKAGEDLVVAAQTNRIEMLGSLRANKNCQECHAVKHGELLGAFSYEFLRTKPIPPEKKTLGPPG